MSNGYKILIGIIVVLFALTIIGFFFRNNNSTESGKIEVIQYMEEGKQRFIDSINSVVAIEHEALRVENNRLIKERDSLMKRTTSKIKIISNETNAKNDAVALMPANTKVSELSKRLNK